MKKEELIKKIYTKPDARLVVFNYKEIVMASGISTDIDDVDPNSEEIIQTETTKE